jgi:hypothetical protein
LQPHLQPPFVFLVWPHAASVSLGNFRLEASRPGERPGFFSAREAGSRGAWAWLMGPLSCVSVVLRGGIVCVCGATAHNSPSVARHSGRRANVSSGGWGDEEDSNATTRRIVRTVAVTQYRGDA